MENILIKSKNNNNSQHKSHSKSASTAKKQDAYRELVKHMAKRMNVVNKGLIKGVSAINEDDQPLYLKTAPHEIANLELPGRFLIQEMILFTKHQTGSTFLTYFIITITFLHCLIPMAFRGFSGKSLIGDTWVEMYLSLFFIVTHFIIFYSIIIILEVGGNDFARRHYMMRQLESFIEADRMSSKIESDFKIMPLMNIFSKKNLNSWMYIRILVMDIGRRYLTKIEVYASSLIFVYSIVLVALVLGFLDVFKGFSIVEYPVFYSLGFAQCIISFILIYRMVVKGSELNYFAESHINQLTELKSTLNLLLSNYNKWKDMNSYINTYLEKAKEFYYYCYWYYSNRSEREIYVDKFNSVVIPKPCDDERFKEYLNELCDVIDYIIDRIRLEDEIRPVRLLGIKLSKSLLEGFYLLLVTLAFTFLQVRLENSVGK